MKLLFEYFNIEYVISELDRIGGVSFKAIPEVVIKQLIPVAMQHKYVRRDSIIMPSGVCQDVYGVDEFPEGTILYDFRDEWQRILLKKMEGFKDFFQKPLAFNELSLQRYESDSCGITPHLDEKKFINLICVFTLMGNCSFCLCKDRKGSDPISLDASPGNAILMRAPGFRRSDHRPFHFVADIQGPRISFGLRQKHKVL